MVRTGGVQVAMAQELQPEKGFESATLTTEMLEKITTDMGEIDMGLNVRELMYHRKIMEGKGPGT